MNDLMDNLSKLNNERASIQMDFVKKTGSYLEPYQQMKLLVFEPYMKEQVKTKMRDGYMRPKPKNKKGLENRNKRLKTIFSLGKFYKFFRGN